MRSLVVIPVTDGTVQVDDEHGQHTSVFRCRALFAQTQPLGPNQATFIFPELIRREWFLKFSWQLLTSELNVLLAEGRVIFLELEWRA
jgi:hypothetical protein